MPALAYVMTAGQRVSFYLVNPTRNVFCLHRVTLHYCMKSRLPLCMAIRNSRFTDFRCKCSRYERGASLLRGRLAAVTASTQTRTAFSFDGEIKKQTYSERRLLGYSMEQMFTVVAEVQYYKEFVPWCVGSDILEKQPNQATALLKIGFAPLQEKYTSALTFAKPHLVKSVCTDGKLFNHLVTVWRFSPGLPEVSQSCVLDFSVDFQFRSSLHAHLASIFFDEVVKQMVKSFLSRAEKIYGRPSFNHSRPKILAYDR